jgi:hypothetical protein
MYVFDFEDSENFGEYDPVEDIIYLNMPKMDSDYALIGTIIHEDIHKAIVNSGEETNEEQDHWVIKKLLF